MKRRKTRRKRQEKKLVPGKREGKWENVKTRSKRKRRMCRAGKWVESKRKRQEKIRQSLARGV